RNGEGGTKATKLLPLNKSVFGIRQHVGDMHDLTLKQGTSHCRATRRNYGQSPDVLLVVVGVAVSCHALVYAVSLAGDRALICLAQPGGSLDQSIQYRFEIECRAAYGLKYVCGGGLLLERFPQLGEQACVLDGDHCLVGKG